MTPRTLISLLNWNSHDQINACLTVLAPIIAKQSHQVIVVDNASQSQSRAAIQAAHPTIPLIESPENLGYAGGHQLAVDYALKGNFDAVWILNSDQSIDRDALTALIEAYQTHGAAVYGSLPRLPHQQDAVGVSTWRVTGGRLPVDYFAPDIRMGDAVQDVVNASDVIAVAAAHGCSLWIPTEIIRSHGFMDTAYFLYSEEYDYCFRLVRAGVPVYLVPDSITYHYSEAIDNPTGRLAPLRQYYYYRNQFHFIRRYFSWRQGWLYINRYSSPITLTKYAIKRLIPQLAGDKDLYYYRNQGFLDELLGLRGRRLEPEQFLTGADDAC